MAENLHEYQETEDFRRALEEHIHYYEFQDHPRADFWRAYHIDGPRRVMAALDLLEPYLPFSLANAKVLDLGCATGSATVAFAWRGCEMVVGLDPSRDFVGLNLARRRSQAQGLEISLIQGDGRTLPFADNSLDFCFCDWILEHVIELEQLLQEIYRVLRCGGAAYFSTNNRVWPYDPHTALWGPPWMSRKWALRYIHWRGRDVPGTGWDVYMVTYQELRQLLHNAGFQIRATWSDILSNYGGWRGRVIRAMHGVGVSIDNFAPNLYFLVQK